MGVKLVSASGGSVEINPPATASNFVATMPAGTGTVSVNGVSSNIVSGTSQASTSGTSIDFTGIPSWVKRITVMFNGVSTNGTSNYLMQIGSGSVETTSYRSTVVGLFNTAAVTASSPTAGFALTVSTTASELLTGHVVITILSGSTWVCSGNMYKTDGNIYTTAGSKTITGTLDRVRITTVNGTDTFDAGSINIMYE